MSSISSGTTLTTALVQTADTSGVLQLQTNGTTTAVTIDTAQNVGIGTTSPVSKMEVAVGTAGGSLNITNTANTNTAKLRVTTSQSSMDFGEDGTGGVVEQLGAYPIRFYNNSTERMRIDSSGNLLLGTTSQLTNGLICASFNPSVKQGITLQNSSGTNCVYIGFNNASNSQIGYISGNGTATAYVTSSDYRLKENVAPMTGALATVAQLKPVTYNWISDKSKGQGFIAHELQAVVPDCVTGEKDAVDSEGKPVYQGIDTSFLVATLTSAIQELSAQVTTLQTQVTALKG